MLSTSKELETCAEPVLLPSSGVNLKYTESFSVFGISASIFHFIFTSAEVSLSVSIFSTLCVEVVTPSPSLFKSVAEEIVASFQPILFKEYSNFIFVSLYSLSVIVVVTTTPEPLTCSGEPFIVRDGAELVVVDIFTEESFGELVVSDSKNVLY